MIITIECSEQVPNSERIISRQTSFRLEQMSQLGPNFVYGEAVRLRDAVRREVETFDDAKSIMSTPLPPNGPHFGMDPAQVEPSNLTAALDYARSLKGAADCFADRACVELARKLELELAAKDDAIRKIFADPVALRANILRHGPPGYDIVRVVTISTALSTSSEVEEDLNVALAAKDATIAHLQAELKSRTASSLAVIEMGETILDLRRELENRGRLLLDLEADKARFADALNVIRCVGGTMSDEGVSCDGRWCAEQARVALRHAWTTAKETTP